MNRSICFSLLPLFFISLVSFKKLQGQVLYETVSSGVWSDLTIWRKWNSGQAGVGTSESAIAFPSGSNKVLIHAGDTIEMGGLGRSCRALIIEAGGKLWANSATPARLQVCGGGNGDTYPVNDTVKVDGVFGGPGDGMVIEPGAKAGTVTITGNGTIELLRIRMPGGLTGSANNGGVVNMIFDANIDLYQHDNYALSAVYNPTTTDNYSMTINPGKTIRLMDTSGFWHNNQYILSGPTQDYGNYTYNILGTLDLRINNQARRVKKFSASILAPQGINSHITVNIDGGVLKTGTVFIADTSVNTPFALISTGVLKLRMVNGGQFDASAAQNCIIGHTSDGAGGYYPLIWASSRGFIQQAVADSTVTYPIGSASSETGNRVDLINLGIEDLFTVSVEDVFDHVPDAPAQVINRQWTISEAVPGGSVVTMRLSWVNADEGTGVSHAAGSWFSIMHWNGNAWEYFPATVTGAGTVNDPYVAEATGIASFSPFGVISNYPSTPVPVLFTDVKAWQHNGAVQIEFVNATELNIKNYEVQRSIDGINFFSFTVIAPLDNTGTRSSYHCTDALINAGGSIFFRIKATDKSAAVFYSPVVKISAAGKSPDFVIYPVPVTGNTINISLQNLTEGVYKISIINEAGQRVYAEKISHPGGSAGQLLHLPLLVQKGMYHLQLSNGIVSINKDLIIL